METIARVMSDTLTARGMNYSDLSRATGISTSSVSRYLAGKDMPATSARKVAAALGLTMDELFGLPMRFTADERELVDCYRSATPAQKSALMHVARTYASDGLALNKANGVA